MSLPFPTLRFARAWLTASSPVEVTEVSVDGPAGPFELARYRRPEAPVGPGWILLHGMTRTGYRHPSLDRFARAVAATGATVVVPEVPEWVGLRLAPHRTRDAVRAGLRLLEEDPATAGRPGLMGFSFGGPQVLKAAADPAVGPELACVAAVGGYGDLERTVHFLLTGGHEWEGRAHRVRPDPYGRWIVAANYLAGVPGYEDAGDVAEALRELAAYAGDYVIESWDESLDPVKAELEASVAPARRSLFRYFAPPAALEPVPATPEAEAWAGRLTAAGLARETALALPGELHIPVPVLLLHGRNDHLIPFSESLRMACRIHAPALRVHVTPLFAHSAGDPGPASRVAWAREAVRLGRTLAWLFRRGRAG